MGEAHSTDEDAGYDGDLPPRLRGFGRGPLRVALLATIAVAGLALLAVPLADRGSDALVASQVPELDMMATGSIDAPRQYTIRRSVLQPMGSEPCILFPDGSKRGAC
ncbi:hypothetical protein [Jiella marina]|uniref:hypothetical protein n=1 Tax=Jiella sp. LLJ827 TaxID=2917712 RepID=UPI00210151CF|nr:hypothetical protein [Jiella sp. LLJ827]MCQ0988984.1 hypothetical protein [Jiella sp. LLJ827]